MGLITWFVLTVIVGTAVALDSDEITSLPGLKEKINFRQYSGYLSGGKDIYLHYWFVESQSNPEKDPVLLWLNGGPGASSLLGLFTENGPFRVAPDNTTVTVDPYSWNTLANVLYLESPVGVGYSYTNISGYCNDDDSTAQINYQALQDFFKKFPQFVANEFYITGESYAGIYIPTLSLQVLKNNAKAKVKINFKGVAIGNGYLDPPLLDTTEEEYAKAHGIEEMSDRQLAREFCPKSSSAYCIMYNELHHGENEQVNDVVPINPYNIYDDRPDCKSKALYRAHILMRKYGITMEQLKSSRYFRLLKDCISEGYQQYMNAQNVRKALHIPDSLGHWDYESGICYNQLYDTMKPQIKEIVEKYKLGQVIIYNGDFDTVCNFIGDEEFVQQLGYEVKTPYQAWTAGQRYGGFVKRYDGITFTTVRASGHMVPGDQPEAALEIVKELIGQGKLQ